MKGKRIFFRRRDGLWRVVGVSVGEAKGGVGRQGGVAECRSAGLRAWLECWCGVEPGSECGLVRARVREWVKAYAKREEKVKNLGVKKIILTNNNDIRKNPFYFFL